MKNTLLLYTACLLSLLSFAQKKPADVLIFNAKIYTVDARFSTASAMVVGGDKILATGDSKTLQSQYNAAEKLDAKGAFIYPGFIDAHAHFLSYGLGLQTANLVGTKSWEEILMVLDSFALSRKFAPGQWIIGRGWDQNDWVVKEYPTKEKLDSLFPSNPVLLTRVDGHAAIVNQQAIGLAGIGAATKINGGELILANGGLTGVLVDNAVQLVAAKIPPPTVQQVQTALTDAQKNCFAVGLTTVEDCGIDYEVAMLMVDLQSRNLLQMRIYAMLSDDPKNFNWAKGHGKLKTPYLNVASFKVYADGALGSRGACLLQPYSDKPAWTGFLRSSVAHFDSVANVIYSMGWQMNTHAIGDSGNRVILNIYGKYLKGTNDRRWRIEHAQVVNLVDFPLFKKYSIIPSVQPTHATSDMRWAAVRLGSDRMKGAYAYKRLLAQNGWLPLGTDFPVEDISPIKTFYAAVFRMDADGYPKGGFQMQDALSREEAIRGATIWAAKSNFEEGEKGSLERGKYADFILLDKDLMTVPAKEVLSAQVIATFIGGKKVYQKTKP